MHNSDYRPNDKVLAALRDVDLVLVVGPSGAGKTTIMSRAAQLDPTVHVVVSDVSRAPRAEEQEGVAYFFRDKQAMRTAIAQREYVQYAVSNSGDISASRPASYAGGDVAILAVWAAVVPTMRALPFRSVRTVFIVPASFEAWQAHLGLHHFPAELQAKRLAEAAESLRFGVNDAQTELLVNDDLGQSVRDFLAIVHRSPAAPLPDQSGARAILQDLLARLKQEPMSS